MAITLPSTYARGDKPTKEQWSAPNKALNGMGVGTDNDGKPILPLSFELPLPILLGASGEEAVQVSGGTTLIVASGKIVVIENYYHAGSVTDTVTPSGGAAITLSANAANGTSRVCLVLTAGDAITMGAGSFCSGLRMNLPTVPAAPVRILQVVDSGVSYTVAANKRALITHASAAAGTPNLLLGGSDAVKPGDPGTTPYNLPRLLATEGQTLAGSTTDDILISGLLLSTV